MNGMGRMLRTALAWTYRGCGALAAVFLAAIGVLVLTSIVSRYLGFLILGLTDYAGYCMAASAFLALAYTFGERGHIRISLLLHFLHGRWRRLAEVWSLAVGSLLAGYFAYYAIRMVQVSHRINDVSQGPDATPLWIPQLGVAVGATVFAVALVHRLVEVALGGELEPVDGEPGFTAAPRPDPPDG
jgi:TRAP-type C4-dicarboxylate transport system permease small subunit